MFSVLVCEKEQLESFRVMYTMFIINFLTGRYIGIMPVSQCKVILLMIMVCGTS